MRTRTRILSLAVLLLAITLASLSPMAAAEPVGGGDEDGACIKTRGGLVTRELVFQDIHVFYPWVDPFSIGVSVTLSHCVPFLGVQPIEI